LGQNRKRAQPPVEADDTLQKLANNSQEQHDTAPWDARANLLALPNLTRSCILTAASTAKLTEFLARSQPALPHDEPLSSACEAAILTSLQQNEQSSRFFCTDGVCEALQNL